MNPPFRQRSQTESSACTSWAALCMADMLSCENTTVSETVVCGTCARIKLVGIIILRLVWFILLDSQIVFLIIDYTICFIMMRFIMYGLIGQTFFVSAYGFLKPQIQRIANKGMTNRYFI